MKSRPIRVGDRVRAFAYEDAAWSDRHLIVDWLTYYNALCEVAGCRARYVEGYVMAIVKRSGVRMYEVEAHREVDGGHEVSLHWDMDPDCMPVFYVPVEATGHVERIGVYPLSHVFSPPDDDRVMRSFSTTRSWRWAELNKVYGIEACLREIRDIDEAPEYYGDLSRMEFLCMSWMDRHGLLDWTGKEHLKAYRRNEGREVYY